MVREGMESVTSSIRAEPDECGDMYTNTVGVTVLIHNNVICELVRWF